MKRILINFTFFLEGNLSPNSRSFCLNLIRKKLYHLHCFSSYAFSSLCVDVRKHPRLDDLQRVEVHLALGSGDRKSKNMLGKIEPHHIQDFEHVNLGNKFPVYEHGSGHFKIMILILDRKGNRGRRIVSSWPA